MAHDRVVAVQIFLPPRRLKELLAGHHLALAAAQVPEDGELQRREGELLPKEKALVVGFGDLQAPDVVLLGDRLRPAARVVAGVAAQLGLDPGHQLQGVEGLCDIVVRPQGEAGDLVHVLHLGGQHENGKEMLLPDLLAKRESVHIGEHHVQNGQIRPLPRHAGQGLPAGAAFVDRVALILQIDLH